MDKLYSVWGRSFITSLFILACSIVSAQKADSSSIDMISHESWLDDFGVYGSGHVISAAVRSKPVTDISLEAGISYKKLKVGGFATQLNGTMNDIVIFPREFSLDYRYGGILVGGQVLDKSWFHCSVLAKAGFGDIVWKDVFDEAFLFRDIIMVFHPEIELDISPISIFRLSIRSGYRWSGTPEIPRMTHLNGFTAAIGIKIVFMYTDE